MAGAVAEEVFEAIKTVVAFEGQQKEQQRYRKELLRAERENLQRSMLSSCHLAFLWFCIYRFLALIFWYGTGAIVDDRHLPATQRNYSVAKITCVKTPQRISFVLEYNWTMFQIFAIVAKSLWMFSLCFPYLETINIGRSATYHLFKVMDNVPVINLAKNNGKKPIEIERNLIFVHVCFE